MLVSSVTFLLSFSSFFFFNDTATTEIYTLSLHDALPICPRRIQIDGRFGARAVGAFRDGRLSVRRPEHEGVDRATRRSRIHGSRAAGEEQVAGPREQIACLFEMLHVLFVLAAEVFQPIFVR